MRTICEIEDDIAAVADEVSYAEQQLQEFEIELAALEDELADSMVTGVEG